MYELRKKAMDRFVKFWNRELSEEILVDFRKGPTICEIIAIANSKTGETNIPEFTELDPEGLFLNFEKMFLEKKKAVINPTISESLEDDNVGIPVVWLDTDFGFGVFGAMFGGKIRVRCIKDRAGNIEFNTDNEPVLKSWDDLDSLKFEEGNYWVQKILSYLDYTVANFADFPTPVALGLVHACEGGNFVVLLRGETTTLMDFHDHPQEVRKAYELGYQYSSRFFEMRRSAIMQYNLNLYENDAYAKLGNNQLLPSLDTDLYAYAGPKIFEEFGFEYKQKIFDRFKGGTLWIHTLGLHLVPIAGKLKNITNILFCNDPKQPRAFDKRIDIRKNTYDIPLHIRDCKIDEFLKALDEKTLPGGAYYNVYVPDDADVSELNAIMKKIRKYKAGKLSGKPNPA